MADEIIASVAISFFVLNLAFGAVGFAIGITSNSFDSFIPIKEQLEAFNILGGDLILADPSRDQNVEVGARSDPFDCSFPIDGGRVPCLEANPLFPLYPSNASSPFGSNAGNSGIFGLFSLPNFFGNIVRVITQIWGAIIFFAIVPLGFAIGAFELLMLIPPFINGVSVIGITIFIIDAFVTIGFGLSFLLTMISRIKP